MNAPVLNERDLAGAIERERAAGRTIAFANGCFDVLHVGHIRYLQGAAKEADVLVVGVNGDESVCELKGAGRPVMSEAERAEIISAIRGVSYVTIFRERSPGRLIGHLKPDVHCKGTDTRQTASPRRTSCGPMAGGSRSSAIRKTTPRRSSWGNCGSDD